DTLRGDVEHRTAVDPVAVPERAGGDVQRPVERQERLAAAAGPVQERQAVLGQVAVDEPFRRRQVDDLGGGAEAPLDAVRRRQVPKVDVGQVLDDPFERFGGRRVGLDPFGPDPEFHEPLGVARVPGVAFLEGGGQLGVEFAGLEPGPHDLNLPDGRVRGDVAPGCLQKPFTVPLRNHGGHSSGGVSTTWPSTTSSSAASASSWATNSMASPSSSAVRSAGRRPNRSRNACRASFPSVFTRSARSAATWGLIRPSGSSHRSSAAAIPVTQNARRRAITSAHFTAISGPYWGLPPRFG